MGKLNFLHDQSIMNFIDTVNRNTQNFDFIHVMTMIPDAFRHFMHYYSKTITDNGALIGCIFYYSEQDFRYKLELVFKKATAEVRPWWTQRLGICLSKYYDFVKPIHIGAEILKSPNSINSLVKKRL